MAFIAKQADAKKPFFLQISHYAARGPEGARKETLDYYMKKAGLTALEIRERIDHHHMDLMAKIVTRLKSVPEGKGTMFDNTMVVYFPNTGETHHSIGTEYPMVIMAGSNTKPKLGSRYIRLPYWNTEGHKKLGNWYTTLLNAAQRPRQSDQALRCRRCYAQDGSTRPDQAVHGVSERQFAPRHARHRGYRRRRVARRHVARDQQKHDVKDAI
ncbi:MAG: hypothetical protein WCT04_15155 [Planctomycetota bacterium]